MKFFFIEANSCFKLLTHLLSVQQSILLYLQIDLKKHLCGLSIRPYSFAASLSIYSYSNFC